MFGAKKEEFYSFLFIKKQINKTIFPLKEKQSYGISSLISGVKSNHLRKH